MTEGWKRDVFSHSALRVRGLSISSDSAACDQLIVKRGRMCDWGQRIYTMGQRVKTFNVSLKYLFLNKNIFCHILKYFP